MKRKTLFQVISAFLSRFVSLFRPSKLKAAEKLRGTVSQKAAWFPTLPTPVQYRSYRDNSELEHGLEVMRLKNPTAPKCTLGDASFVQEFRKIPRKMAFPTDPPPVNVGDDKAFLEVVGSLPEIDPKLESKVEEWPKETVIELTGELYDYQPTEEELEKLHSLTI